MNKEIKDKWVAALRSGKYGKARDQLGDGRGKYCCLGVLCRVMDAEFERNESLLPSEVATMADLSGTEQDTLAALNDGWSELPEDIKRSVAKYNDINGAPHKSIADWIEKNL